MPAPPPVVRLTRNGHELLTELQARYNGVPRNRIVEWALSAYHASLDPSFSQTVNTANATVTIIEKDTP